MEAEKTEIIYRTPKLIKLGIVLLLLIIGCLTFAIIKISDLTTLMLMPPFTFTDGIPGLVSAEGSWISSDTVLANPLQTINVECWQDWGNCYVITTQVSEGNSSFLSSSSDVYEIARWTPDVIETIPQKTALGCVEYQLRMDRRSKTVSMIRSTVDNKSGLCRGIQDTPITMTLVDGQKRIEQARRK